MSAPSFTSASAKPWLTVAAAAAVSHLPVLEAGYAWLDHAHIEGRLALAPPGRWLDPFLHPFAGTGFYRPLMGVSLSLDDALGGPFLFHATSLAWHVAAALATVLAAGALGLSRRAATFAGGLFAVHPIAGLVVGAIAFRSEAMVAAFLLGFLWAHLTGRRWAAAGLLLASCFTKEIAFGLAPLWIAVLELSVGRTTSRDLPSPRALTRQPRKPLAVAPPSRHRASLLGFEGVAFVVALAMRLAFAPGFRALHAAMSPGDAIGTRLAALSKSGMALLVPIDRTVCDAFVLHRWWEPASVGGMLLLAGILALATLAWRRRGPALFFALAMLPSLQIVPVMRWWSPHYLYVPAAFGAMMIAEVLDRRSDRARLVAQVLAGLLAALSFFDARKYRDDVSLWTPEVASQPACREGQFYLAETERDGREWEAAARRYEAALASYPRVLAYVDRGAALENLGAVRLEQERFDDARVAFTAALEGTTSEHTRRELVHNLGALALRRGDASEADRLLAPETARSDALPASLMVRAMALRQLGRVDEAKELLGRVPH